ncbi:maestro heat-like repeat-containing protein family member 2A isoform X2 [Rhinatrema bivittatum]|nr:maestro heat-like repeat-containing protein family member 2A isoform X2 [Rhinatrema bivittatum]
MLSFLREANEIAVNDIISTIIQYELAKQKEVVEILLEILQQEELTLRHHINIYSVLQQVIEHIGSLPHKLCKIVTALATRDISKTPDETYDLCLLAGNLIITLKRQRFYEVIHSLWRCLAKLTLLHYFTFTTVVMMLAINVFAIVHYPVIVLVTIPCILALTKTISISQEVSTVCSLLPGAESVQNEESLLDWSSVACFVLVEGESGNLLRGAAPTSSTSTGGAHKSMWMEGLWINSDEKQASKPNNVSQYLYSSDSCRIK